MKEPRYLAATRKLKAVEDIDELALQCRFTDCAHNTEPGCAIKAAIVAKKPPQLGHAEAAAMALTSLTAIWALEDTARLKRGETILIQGGAGGVAGYVAPSGNWSALEREFASWSPSPRVHGYAVSATTMSLPYRGARSSRFCWSLE